MSYCRWSKDSDIYCYADDAGHYIIQVAMFKYSDAIGLQERIGLEYDGTKFTCKSLQDTVDMLKTLRKLGYAVPDRAFCVIKDEGIL